MDRVVIDLRDLSPEAEERAHDRVSREFADARARQAAKSAEEERIAARLPMAYRQRARLVGALQAASMVVSSDLVRFATANNVDDVLTWVGIVLTGPVVEEAVPRHQVDAARIAYNAYVAFLKDEPVQPVYRAVVSSSAEGP